jgi:hypothetical protein
MRSLIVAMMVLGGTAWAEDKKAAPAAPAKPSGQWAHDSDSVEIVLNFQKDDLKLTAKLGDASVTVTCKWEMDKEGTIKATVTDVIVKGDFPEVPKKGIEMSFKFKVDGKKAKLSDFKSKDLDVAKPVMEGEYIPKAD